MLYRNKHGREEGEKQAEKLGGDYTNPGGDAGDLNQGTARL